MPMPYPRLRMHARPRHYELHCHVYNYTAAWRVLWISCSTGGDVRSGHATRAHACEPVLVLVSTFVACVRALPYAQPMPHSCVDCTYDMC